MVSLLNPDPSPAWENVHSARDHTSLRPIQQGMAMHRVITNVV